MSVDCVVREVISETVIVSVYFITLLFDLCETADEKARNIAVVLGADVSER